MDIMLFLEDFLSYTTGRAVLVWFVLFLIIVFKIIKICKCFGKRKKTVLDKYGERLNEFSQQFIKLIKRNVDRRAFKQILIGCAICVFSITLIFVLALIEEFFSVDISKCIAFGALIAFVSASISAFLSLKEIALYLFDLAISGNSDYKAKNTIILIKVIYFILISFWVGIFFIFRGTELKKPIYHPWAYTLGTPEIGFLYISYFLMIIAIILLLVQMLSIVFSYDVKKQVLSERIKFIIFNYFQMILLLTGLVICSSILFGDFGSILTELTIKGFFNCLYMVFLSFQDISILYPEVVSVHGKIVLIICSFCNLLFIGMFIGTFLERE